MLILRLPKRKHNFERFDTRIGEYVVSVGGVGMCVEKAGIHHSFVALACDQYYLRYLLNKMEHKHGATRGSVLDGQPILH